MSKVLFILPTLSAGGAENYALRFIKYYREDFEFHILSVNSNKGDLHEEFECLNIQLFHQSIGYFNPRKAHELYKLLKKYNYDTVVSFTGNFSGLPLTIAKYAGVKNRIVFHRRSTNAFGNNPIKLFYNKMSNLLLRKNATKILSNSETALKNFYGNTYQRNSKYKIIKNGVSATDFNIDVSKITAREKLNLPQNKFIIGHVGRFDPAKNHETIFKVIQILKEHDKKFRFVFCGKGTDSDGFLSQLEKYNIQDMVITLGLINDVPILYKALDLFYFPSITEGQPNALIEAMISGLPVVTSNIEPILDSLPDEAKPLTISPTDVLKASEILSLFLNNTIETKKYVHQNWAIKSFDVETNFNEFKKLL